MKKINGNYTTQSQNNFPLDCETLKYIQDNRQMVEILGNIAGDKVILNGCTLNSAKTDRSSGYVFVKTTEYPDGEVLYFEGGKVADGMFLKKTNVSVTANAEPYPAAYVERTLAPGTGTESYSWTDFVMLSDKTNRALMDEITALKAQIAGLAPAPIGSIQMWPSDTLPVGYKLCDGSSLDKTEYAALYAVLGTTYGGSGNLFNLPNLKGRFVAGKDPGVTDYAGLAKTGGANKVALGVSEMPKHNHDSATSTSDKEVSTSSEGKHSHNVNWGTYNGSGDGYYGARTAGASNFPHYVDTSSSLNDTWYGEGKSTENTKGFVAKDGEHSHSFDTYARGGDVNGATAAHENRPPFIVLNYIIKVQ
jgi:microcystin-dependent protein